MNQETISEKLAESIGGRILDQNNISWKKGNGKWIGKRAVWTIDRRACWLEETTQENVKTWWHGQEADYNETFYR